MICAWLAREFGVLPDKVRSLTRGQVRAIFNWPTDKVGNLRRPPAPMPEGEDQDGAEPGEAAARGTPVRPVCEEDRLARHYFLRGWPPHKIAPKVYEVLAQRERERREQDS